MNRRKEIYTKVSRTRRKEKSFSSQVISSLFSLVLLILCCTAVVLSERIYVAGGFDPVIDQWNQITASFNLTHLKQWLFLEKWLNGQILQVSQTSYQHIDGKNYEVSNHEVFAIDDGIVIYCSKQNDDQVVMIRQDNGLIVTYGQLNEVFCNEDDRVIAGTLIAKVQNCVTLDFTWQGESISYEEALEFKN